MSSDDHNPAAYRQLFAVIGAALQATALIFILASLPVAPWWAVAILALVWLVSTVWSWRSFGERPWAPLIAGTLIAVCWIAVLTVST
jgi:hypothetical protein